MLTERPYFIRFLSIRFLVSFAILLVLYIPALSAQHSTNYNSSWEKNIHRYVSEVEELRKQLNIPGLALAIVENGTLVYEGSLGKRHDGSDFETHTPLRIASVTKSLAAVLVMQAVDREELALSDPVQSYITDFNGPAEVTLAHLLSHTSEGIPGEEYVYGTNRYALLKQILESATGYTFEELLRERVLEPAGMDFYASPYMGAHAGLVSTVQDMAKYAIALDNGVLLSEEIEQDITSARQSVRGHTLPIGLGWFVQEVQGVAVTWSFGQDDPDHSGALLLRIPDKKLSLFILANANYLSDPFRLLMGDVSKSPFAMSFMRLFAFSRPGAPMPGLPSFSSMSDFQFDASESESSEYSFEDEVLGRFLVALWNQDREAVDVAWEIWSRHYPGAGKQPDAALLLPLVMMGDEPYTTAGLDMAVRLVESHPNNRWILLPTAYLYEQVGSDEMAIPYYERILDLPNQEADFLHRLFQAWALSGLAKYWRNEDKDKAVGYLKKALALNVGGGTQAEVEALLSEIEN